MASTNLEFGKQGESLAIGRVLHYMPVLACTAAKRYGRVYEISFDRPNCGIFYDIAYVWPASSVSHCIPSYSST